jgi:predicted esterase
MRKLILLSVLAIIFACKKDETPQEPTIPRYLEFVFDEVNVETVTYSSDTLGLEMDVYQPVGDANTNRPVIVLAHGGGFVGGERTNPVMVRLGENLAKRGYVVASITYRLAPSFQSLLDSITAADVVIKAIGDARAAVRFLRKTAAEDGNPFGINPDAIFMGGNSAGAVLTLHMGYLDQDDPIQPFFMNSMQDNGGFEGNSGNPGYSSSVKAIFNMAGGIARINWIDANDVPAIHFHGINDDVVPYECDNVFLGLLGGLDVINLCGSKPIHDKATAIGIESTLNSYNGAHVPWMNPTTGSPNALFDEVEGKIVDFLFAHL